MNHRKARVNSASGGALLVDVKYFVKVDAG